jgi:hypothetical protein
MARVCRPGGRVVVSDMVAPDPHVRQAFDDLHRLVDPSHVKALLPEEIADLLASEVGSIDRTMQSGPFRIPIDRLLTEASNPESVRRALSNELDGGTISGFEPISEERSGPISVSFRSAVVYAAKEGAP